ncbi:MAG: carboxypeptidase-like regulatory domain-containing protein, partial [Muribaculaceae bacterium]|nr:carboxypeptidase-like regulatory domain-containing protein [Muribaculaceae bacterium]
MKTPLHIFAALLFMLFAAGLSMEAAAQTIQLSGTVVEAGTGEPLIGASVAVKGTKLAAATDLDGAFAIKGVDPKATIVVSYVSFKTREIALEGRSQITVELTPDNELLEEVVVIGYGTMDKKELTSAISHVGEKDFLSVSSLDPSMLIQGKVPGVSITNTGAADPNNQASIQIRGVSSRSAGLGPLIVIDGVPGGNLTNLNANDIASFDVLKDGAASAIYGTRGSNGVILVTTKKGTKDGAIHTSYSGTFAWDKIKKELDMMNAQEYRDVRLGWGDNGVDLGGNYDWLDGVSRTGFAHHHTLSLSGGNDRSNYRVSVDYRDH